MKEKIDWYQEVLDLEPGSKVFFPLGKLLAQNNEVARAVDTLQHGLERHPEFIEARLYLIELLHQNSDADGNKQKLEQQLTVLTPLLSRYAGFWKAWGSSAQVTSQKGDIGLAIAFLAALFQDNSLSLSEIVTKGLQMVLGAEGKTPSSTGGGGSAAVVDSDAPMLVEEAVPAFASPVTEAPKWEEGEDFEDEEEGEERFSLRTRSMAEVLAEQGDFAGSLEIYQELIASTTSPQEKEDLQSRMNTLSAHLGSSQEKEQPEEEVTSSPGKDRILSVLETLAERLENRVHS